MRREIVAIGLVRGGMVMNRTVSKRLRAGTALLIVCGLLLSSALALTTYGSAAGGTQAGDSGYDYQFRIDWLKINYQRSKNGDNDWMLYEVRVMRGEDLVFYEKREGQLTTDKPLTSIQSGDYIGLTDQQRRWSNPFVIDHTLQDSDVVIGTFTIANQSHENHDPDKQRKKWSKFVDTEDKSLTLAKLIALPTGAAPLVGEVGDIYVGLLKAVGIVWDLVSPPLGHDVNCDGPVLLGYWKYTGADLLRLTNNQRKTHNFSVHDTSSDKPASECGHPPDTEVGISIVNQGLVGNFGSGPSPSVKTTNSPVNGGPAGAWAGEWVEHVYVKNSKYDVWIGLTPRPRIMVGRAPTYQVTVRELAAPGSSQVVFQTSAQGISPAPAQLPTLRRAIGTLNHVVNFAPVAFNLTEPFSQGPKTTQGPRIGLASADALDVGNGVTLYLYAIYSNNRLLNYAVRYYRQGAADVILQPAQKPLG